MKTSKNWPGEYVAFSGGVGGAKLVHGLANVLDANQLTVIANTGDDFEHLGLYISPDIDTLLYTLTGLADPIRGWGCRGETWNFMEALRELKGETWFQLGDRDLALHIERSRMLGDGSTLTEITEQLSNRLGSVTKILPMSNDPVRTRILTDEGWLDFQRYFVEQQCKPVARAVSYNGADRARANPALLETLQSKTLRGVIICPSNPILSIQPMLALPEIRHALSECQAPVIAVSPLIGGRAIKGPTDKLLRELGHQANNQSIANVYANYINALVIDGTDDNEPVETGIKLLSTDTLMRDIPDRKRLARYVLAELAR